MIGVGDRHDVAAAGAACRRAERRARARRIAPRQTQLHQMRAGPDERPREVLDILPVGCVAERRRDRPYATDRARDLGECVDGDRAQRPRRRFLGVDDVGPPGKGRRGLVRIPHAHQKAHGRCITCGDPNSQVPLGEEDSGGPYP